MKTGKIGRILAVCIGASLLAGCGSEKQNIYRQAEENLEQGSYQEALTGYETSVSSGYKAAESLRGAGIAKLRLGDYQGAVECFTQALSQDRVKKFIRQDLLAYRATALLKAGLTDDAMADCQTLASDYSMNADLYFLTGCVALAMDAYDEADSNFQQAYGEKPDYDMALQIYEAYRSRGMEADGTRYLEAILKTEPGNAEDYCERGRIYYYMQDYENARNELTKASEKGSVEALSLLGMVCLARNDTAAARSMYQDYLNAEESRKAEGYNGLALCDIADGDYPGALANIASGLEAADTDEMQELLFNEIVAYEKQLDFHTAFSKVQEYLKMYPDDQEAKKELEFLQSRIAQESVEEPVQEESQDTVPAEEQTSWEG
ncbi:tetratricopeptide repeat protein [Blautia sp. XA-2221]|uniref:tetratricopeptide repeat protein n=1 Tax=Blautia sp. XA-2221 TaxID=2903961 RepID=UPI002379A57F|nr:tetratricopeptide repeat protein [Blautia sp. XA-2221]